MSHIRHLSFDKGVVLEGLKPAPHPQLHYSFYLFIFLIGPYGICWAHILPKTWIRESAECTFIYCRRSLTQFPVFGAYATSVLEGGDPRSTGFYIGYTPNFSKTVHRGFKIFWILASLEYVENLYRRELSNNANHRPSQSRFWTLAIIYKNTCYGFAQRELNVWAYKPTVGRRKGRSPICQIWWRSCSFPSFRC